MRMCPSRLRMGDIRSSGHHTSDWNWYFHHQIQIVNYGSSQTCSWVAATRMLRRVKMVEKMVKIVSGSKLEKMVSWERRGVEKEEGWREGVAAWYTLVFVWDTGEMWTTRRERGTEESHSCASWAIHRFSLSFQPTYNEFLFFDRDPSFIHLHTTCGGWCEREERETVRCAEQSGSRHFLHFRIQLFPLSTARFIARLAIMRTNVQYVVVECVDRETLLAIRMYSLLYISFFLSRRFIQETHFVSLVPRHDLGTWTSLCKTWHLVLGFLITETGIWSKQIRIKSDWRLSRWSDQWSHPPSLCLEIFSIFLLLIMALVAVLTLFPTRVQEGKQHVHGAPAFEDQQLLSHETTNQT